ncbi:MAG: VCBS repeat-containing protein [Bryobacterales bacterium]|nr:VCBS repeat-containing protein [Bryobacterales bacterium]
MQKISSTRGFSTPRAVIVLLAVFGLLAGSMWLIIDRPHVATAASEEELWQLRNLGKAFYENPTTQKEAVETFRKALTLAPGSVREKLNYGLALMHAGDTEEGTKLLQEVQRQQPNLPHPWFVLGVHYRKSGEEELAIAQFERMAALAPDEPKTQYNLGVLYKQLGDNERAIRQFERAAELEPTLAAPHFQLFNMYRLAGDRDKANTRLATFKEIKAAQEGAVIPEDMDWSDYAEIYDPVDPVVAATDQMPPPRLIAANEQIGSGVDPATARSLVLDATGDGKPSLVVWWKQGVRLYLEGSKALESAALASFKQVHDVAAADFDNDGLTDLVVLTSSGAHLLRNTGGDFQPQGPALAQQTAFTKAIWLDYDHDYDLDLILLGDRPAVFRNQGAAGFQAQPNAIGFVPGKAIDAAIIRQIPDSKAMDFVVSYSNRAGVLYKDRLGGSFEARNLPEVPANASQFQVADFDHNGTLDLAFLDGLHVTLLSNFRGTWALHKKLPANGSFLLADFAALSVHDLLTDGVLLDGDGAAYTQSREASNLPERFALAAADFDGDGRLDVAGVTPQGTIVRSLNQTEGAGRWLRITLKGVKAPALAKGSVVEVKAGPRYQKFLYTGAPLHVGVRASEKVDTIRITWPHGLIQNEMNQATSQAYRYEEAQRLSGSCPMIFTWNGRKFTFITDVLGVAPLGAKSGDGSYFPTNSDEYIWIDGEHLRERNGNLEIRITEELGEVSYLDMLELIAVDHPVDVDVFSNEKWKSPPYPEFRLYGTNSRRYPVRAYSQGQDVLAAVAKRDQVYVDNFKRNFQNVAEMHALELDFGSVATDNRAFLVLNGWVDWADGSTFLAREQEGDGGLVPPYLQVRDAKGKWQTVIDDLGMPSGKTKTLAVDLTGKFLSASREVRIVTNLCVFWDEVFLGEDAAAPTVKLTPLSAREATLGYHGFSTSIIHPERKKPEHSEYEPTTPVSYWNPTKGNYTRYGDILRLITDVDDRFAIMGSADEVRLAYRASDAPPLPNGWKRDYLLRVEGWAKDADANTAFGDSVEPLPFRSMSQYPYPPTERYPDTPSHREYRETMNTRPALLYTRPLAR